MGTRKNRLFEAVLRSTHNQCFEQKYKKKYQIISVRHSTIEYTAHSMNLNQYICMFAHKTSSRERGGVVGGHRTPYSTG